MPLSDDQRICHYCRSPIPARHFSFARRVEQAAPLWDNGRQVTGIQVLSDNILLEFCCQDCWQGRVPEVIAAFSLRSTYPHFAMLMRCSTCDRTIDCAQPHVTLNVYEIEEHVAPWLTTGQMLEDRLFAVQCGDCDPPGETEATSGADEEQDRQKASADAAQ